MRVHICQRVKSFQFLGLFMCEIFLACRQVLTPLYCDALLRLCQLTGWADEAPVSEKFLCSGEELEQNQDFRKKSAIYCMKIENMNKAQEFEFSYSIVFIF